MTLFEGELRPGGPDARSTSSRIECLVLGLIRPIGMLMDPGDFSEDLDEEMWSLTKRLDETVQALNRRL